MTLETKIDLTWPKKRRCYNSRSSLKLVDSAEYNPTEYIKTNVIGAQIS